MIDKTTGEHMMRIRCLECNTKIKTYRSKEEIRLEIYTNTNAGIYPVELCPACWDFWRDKTKKATDNLRSMSRVGI